ncbi:MAG TPA: methylmalonyl Co-A mutase-associated GTPase MeaB [Cytophagales bacterium]|nr:methylmalonyl Co-A mutase-associated GTPase MeaB [Cytophagales bacterium]HAA22895.1 methylmalonyl Co-A mutase-associated GTPase MeaB [Cytophagales bacterium]
MAYRRKNRLSVDAYVSGVLAGDRMVLSRAVTLVESTLVADQALAEEVLAKLLPHTGHSLRIGITGVPGVGKSTFIESFGSFVTSLGKKLAVLAIDPTSQRSRGSIMGDKTRMEKLAHDPLAYIRPSPSGDALGGVTHKTRETMLLCEAAGFEVIFIETVGVGQSETAVHGMVDFFLLLMLAGAGDELQGIKKGIMEMADAIAITKADGENKDAAKRARREYQNALHLFPLASSGWSPKVLTCSALDEEGLDDIWELLLEYQQKMKESGYFGHRRKEQNRHWMHEAIRYMLMRDFYTADSVSGRLAGVEAVVERNEMPAMMAAKSLLAAYHEGQS